MDNGKSALGIDANLAAAIGYPIVIIAIICLIMDKENKFIKFHALQAILLSVAIIVLWIALVVLSIILGVIGVAMSAAGSAGGALGGIVGLLWTLVMLVFGLGALIAIIMGAVKAYGGSSYKLPIIGNMAEKFANK
ncbi:MAG TPA: DUF4870 domain-containing protein [Pyrinomonadaceae bacterium]|nr:DUF4870 domain-containing protein [Pyrinomonadaceae bacterium]